MYDSENIRSVALRMKLKLHLDVRGIAQEEQCVRLAALQSIS